MKVIIYSTTTCPYCKMLKDYLDEKKVEYVEKLVDQVWWVFRRAIRSYHQR
jgi:glutaredoxin